MNIKEKVVLEVGCTLGMYLVIGLSFLGYTLCICVGIYTASIAAPETASIRGTLSMDLLDEREKERALCLSLQESALSANGPL